MLYRLKETVAILLLALTAASCEYKDIDEYEFAQNSVLVDFGWKNVDSIPKSFRIMFYPILNGTETYMPESRVFDIYNGKAELKNIRPGNYHVVAWNTDTEHNKIDGYNNVTTLAATTPDYFSVSTGETGSLDSIFNGQKVLDTPDYMLHADIPRFQIRDNELEQPMMLYPDSMIVTVDCRIRKFRGLSGVKEIRGAISNVARRRFLSEDNLTKDTATVMFECRRNEKDSLVYAHFYLYGILPHELNKAEHQLTLLFWLEDRNVWFRIPVTDKIARYRRDDRYVLIDVDNLNVDLFKGGASGFEIEIQDWDDIKIDIPW